MSRQRKASPQTLALLSHFLQEPTAWHYGYDLARTLDLRSGTLYPILARLSDRGLLQQQDEPPSIAGRPPRRLYRLSGEGAVEAARLVEQARASRVAPRSVTGGLRARTAGA
ncbi:MAG: PadR family transcriptional regulator, regulatory protein PadR [Actinomycetota bacterium]|nr:PadR family transcriptional regulator, regulatory protein PadR [Actinomycetota bacterium]